tara:strand:+ start:1315 stop:1530 length:216 start_codon:yes stop_codon:yes gene_type:complete
MEKFYSVGFGNTWNYRRAENHGYFREKKNALKFIKKVLGYSPDDKYKKQRGNDLWENNEYFYAIDEHGFED